MSYPWNLDIIHPTWKPFFASQRKLLGRIQQRLDQDALQGKIIYPEPQDVFKVFTMDFYDIKVLLLGQDPYIQKNQAMGLSFSVPKEEKIPPSLQNIFRELHQEYPGTYTFTHGDLTSWFERERILLLNASLTVEEGTSGSHMSLWQTFTDRVISYLATYREDVVYLFFGNFAQRKCALIPKHKQNDVLTCVHPSPLSARRGFFGSRIFQKTNEALIERSQSPVCWQN